MFRDYFDKVIRPNGGVNQLWWTAESLRDSAKLQAVLQLVSSSEYLRRKSLKSEHGKNTAMIAGKQKKPGDFSTGVLLTCG